MDAQWEFKMEGDSLWHSAQVPGTIHQDLMRTGQIENIYYAKNEEQYQWIESKNWSYRCEFSLEDSQDYNLIFEGLDTYAQVFIDDSLFGTCDNMFRLWRFDLSNLSSGLHQLRIEFKSPYQFLKEKVQAYPVSLPSGSETGDLKVSPFSRKAAYHFGWDWAPRIVTCGIFRPLYLEPHNPKIEQVEVSVLARRDSTVFAEFNYEISHWEPGLKLLFQGQEFDLDQTQFRPIWKKFLKAKLWWPNGYGNPHLYYDTLRLYKEGKLIQEFPFRYGLRTVELVNEPDSLGTSFYFKINGKPLFAKGANYVPQDMLLPRVSNQQYRSLMQKVANANMNMLRVWGGGVYERDLFYQLCDSLGIMLWQDFMFAGTMYPADQKDFLENVALEVEDNVKRLRHHPSIVIWCGNNEIEVAWKNWGWQKQLGYNAEDSTRLWKAYLALFDSLIPKQLAHYDSNFKRPYTSTSPLSNWGKAENFKHSTMHYWGVWHGGDDFEKFAQNVGRFMVEYGFQSFPNYQSIRRVIPDSAMYLESTLMQHRQKSYVGNGEILRQVNKYYGQPKDFKQFLELSQKAQAKALKMAIAEHRIQQGFCMGSLMWQLNDCWPGPSWSIIDYYGNEKEAYQTVRQGFRKDFWLVKKHLLFFVVEAPRELKLTLRFRNSDRQTISVVINRNFEKPGVYQINLKEDAVTKKLQAEAELRYLEALFN